MRIVNLQQFLTLPSGTLYQRYKPSVAESLEIKWDNCGERDWVLQDLEGIGIIENNGSDQLFERLDDMQHNCASYPAAFDFAGRDGCARGDEMFLVYERDDVARLIKTLQDLPNQ